MRICPSCGKHVEDGVLYCPEDGTRLSSVADFAPNSTPSTTGLRLLNTVLGSYRLLKILGEGGMGRVYLAEHTRLGRRVALKTLRSEYASNPSAVRRFFREARAVNQIRHENIVEITDFIEQEGGENYYIMELLEGVNLAEVLSAEGALPQDRILRIGLQIASALASVHEAGIVHRDLKSENIFLVERSGQKDFAKLFDFGVAKLYQPTVDPAVWKTQAGAILGTPEYMSPEQASGKEVDYRSDIYSFGIILFEMVTGQKPFKGKSFGEMVIKHLTVRPPRPSRMKDLPRPVDPALEELVLACLEKDPVKRPPSMRAVETRLLMLRGQAQADAPTLVPRPARRAKAWLATGLLLVLVLAGVGGWAALRPGEEAAQPAGPAAVEVSFDSAPPGAQVFAEGAVQPLGRTPFRASFDRAERRARFEFVLEGYQRAREEVGLGSSSRLLVTLAKLEPPPEPEEPPLVPPEVERPVKDPKKPPVKTGPGKTEKPDKPDDKGPDKPEDLGATIDPFE
ncbi:MAG TPA: protein kinase [Myxococcota bacterium]|nr:protein kinase [Myxococcota bacterium]HRY93809.1 protein kinase [Myxococcota bacterium]HSA21610.1 protein kinase [Myxococcota bacterium]